MSRKSRHIKPLLLALALTGMAFIPLTASDNPEVYFYAANDRPSPEEQAILKKEVIHQSDRKAWLHTYIRSEFSNWEILKTERIRIKSSGEHRVALYIGGLRQQTTIRTFTKNMDLNYYFEERREGVLVRKGQTRSQIPLHLEGLVTEYHVNGQKKSESYYRDNQLVWNRNWLKNGEKYIDTIFFSVDTWPQYREGEIAMKAYINNYIIDSKFYSNDLHGTVLLGFVIMENGELSGVHLVNDPMPGISGIVMAALQTLPGEWEPAVLDNRKVRCYMTFPVNFKTRDVMQFESVQMVGNMIFYNYY